MSISIKLDAYFDTTLLSIKTLYDELSDTIKFQNHPKIALAPAGRIAEEVINKLISNGYSCKGIYVYDKDTEKVFPIRTYDYSAVKLHKPDKIFITSSRYANAIKMRFLTSGFEEKNIIDINENLPQLISIAEARDHIFSSENRENVDFLMDILHEKDVVIVNCATLFYDVNEKVKIIKEELKRDVVWIDHTISAKADKNGTVRANIIDAMNFIKRRNRRDNIVYFSVNPVWHLVMLYLMRMTFPEIKIILYKYDWLNLFCPYEHKDILQKFLNLPMDYIESEYRVFDLILSGDIVDGLLYKDGGETFPVLKDYALPKMYFPAFLPKRLYQNPPGDITESNRMLYLGKLFSGNDFPAELFGEVFLFEVLDEIAKQGYFIDLLYVDSPVQSVNAYKDYFRGNHCVRIIEGKPLNDLLPEIAGRYQWGYVVGDFRKGLSVNVQHVEMALPARLFTFLALGIPIVISKELKYSADFIVRNGIGVTIGAEEITNIGAILKAVDYAKLRKNVLNMREQLSLESIKGEFIDFIQRIEKGVRR